MPGGYAGDDERYKPLELKQEFSFEWTVKGINAALSAAKAGENRRLESNCTEDGRWVLQLNMRGSDDKEYVGVYLRAYGDKLDEREPSSSLLWTRSGDWEATIEFKSSTGTWLSPPIYIRGRNFDSKSPSWGCREAIPWAALDRDRYDFGANAFVISCTMSVKNAEPHARPSRADVSPLVRLFRSPQYADVAFRIKPPGAAGPSYLFATELVALNNVKLHRLLTDPQDYPFYSRRARSRSRSRSPPPPPEVRKVKFDPKKLPSARPRDHFKGDLDEFFMFRALLPDNPHDASPVDDETSRRCTRSRTRSRSPLPRRERHSRSRSPDRQPQQDEDDGESAAEKQQLEVTAKQKPEAPVNQKELKLCEISDCSWSTFRAFLKFLHGGNPHFTHLPSEYFVAYDSTSASGMPPPMYDWIADDLPDLWYYLCEPHALYRLADRFEEEEMKELAKGYILRSLTVENVAYEAFCQLSLDFPDDFQKPVLAFMLDHWNEVKSSKSFSQVVELFEAGDLPGGKEVLKKIFDGLAAAPKMDDEKKKT